MFRYMVLPAPPWAWVRGGSPLGRGSSQASRQALVQQPRLLLKAFPDAPKERPHLCSHSLPSGARGTWSWDGGRAGDTGVFWARLTWPSPETHRSACLADSAGLSEKWQ